MTRLPLNNKRYLVAALAIVSAVTLQSGCKDKPQPAAPAVAEAPKQEVKPVQKPVSSAIKLPPAPAGNQFDFSNKKDPFKPAIVVKPPVPVTADARNVSVTGVLPIHNFDVSQFRLIGVVHDVKENKAMVVDPNGKGYVLKVGMTIGKNDGRITTITTAGVDVVEQFKDDNGRVRKEVIKITLPRKQ